MQGLLIQSLLLSSSEFESLDNILSNNLEDPLIIGFSHGRFDKSLDILNYGLASDQINISEGEFLHQLGYNGSDVSIAVIDAGFTNVDKIEAFSQLWDNGQILGYWDFVNNNDSVFDNYIASNVAIISNSNIFLYYCVVSYITIFSNLNIITY